MPVDLDEVTLVVQHDRGGPNEFTLWEEVTIADDFLTPCQTCTLKVGADETRFELTKAIAAGDRFQVLVNGHSQISGFVDKVSVRSGRQGTTVTVTGRDTLSPVVDGNADPRMQVKKSMTLEELATELFANQFKLDVSITDEAAAHRNVAAGKPVKPGPAKRRRKITDPLKELRPRDNEGGFQYFTRIAHRSGFHAWASADGSKVVIATPDYDQEPAYDIVSKRGQKPGAAGGNMVEQAEASTDLTGVPSVVRVRGKSTQPGEKTAYNGMYDNAKMTSRYVPFYCVDDDVATKAQADQIARYLAGKAMRHLFTYQCTVRGLTDPVNKRVWNVDTVANVVDEFCGVDGAFWVMSRTLRKSRQGTFTDLTLIPLGTMLFDYPPELEPPAWSGSYKADKKPTDWNPAFAFAALGSRRWYGS